MLSFNGLLAIGLLLANTAFIDAAVIIPPNPPHAPRPTRIQKHLKSGSDAQDFAAGFHEEMNPSFKSVHGLKKDFSGAERWKDSLKNPGGLPIPRVVTHAPEVTLVGRSIPTQSIDRKAPNHRLARRQYDYTNIYDYPPFPQYGYGPQQLAPVDEDEARLTQYEEFKAEMKRIPDEAGIPRSTKSPFRSGPETQKVVESESTEEDLAETEDPDVAQHNQLEGDQDVEPGTSSSERGSMDDAVDVLDQVR